MAVTAAFLLADRWPEMGVRLFAATRHAARPGAGVLAGRGLVRPALRLGSARRPVTTPIGRADRRRAAELFLAFRHSRMRTWPSDSSRGVAAVVAARRMAGAAALAWRVAGVRPP